jgi:AcrR family transcriptional regulator
MCPRKIEDNERNREEAAKRILQGALRVFSRQGYHASSMAEVAEEAGVSKGLAYHYFASKEELLVSIAEVRLQQYLPLLQTIQDIKDPEERLQYLVDFAFNELTNKTDEMRFYNALYLHAEGAAAINKAMKKYRAQFDQLISLEEKMLRELEFANPRQEATFFRSILQGISLEYLLSPKDYPLQQMKEMLLSRYKSKKRRR